ncbi:MAG: acyl carrier protein [Pseudomonadota bacterium]
MSAPDVQGRVLELLAARAKTTGTLGPDTKIMAETNLDSVSVMDFVLELEDEFDVTVPLNRMAEIETVADLAGAIETLMNDN